MEELGKELVLAAIFYFALAVYWLPIVCTILTGLLTTAVGIALILPGPEPERTFQRLADFFAKYSRKP